MEYKKEKGRAYLRQTVNSVITAGIILLLTGIYYWVVKAGIPYQDPPPELQIQYAVNMGIGNLLVKEGLLISLCGAAVRLLIHFAFRSGRRAHPEAPPQEPPAAPR